jgi:hypothetical protein
MAHGQRTSNVGKGSLYHELGNITSRKCQRVGRVGRAAGRTIHELGAENLPVAESIKKVESREKKRLKVEQKRQLQNPPA